MQSSRRLIVAAILLMGACLPSLDAGRNEAATRPDVPTLSPLLPEDRVLVLAPHPDDEISVAVA
jgi:hypothetical protein